jgi:hypothetical protein
VFPTTAQVTVPVASSTTNDDCAAQCLITSAGGRGVRLLGVPTVADRVVQTVARMWLEPTVEPIFHPDSYGYRPKKSALDAIGTCPQRCWRLTGSLTWTSPDHRTQHRHSAGDHECQATAQPGRPAAVDARVPGALADPQRGPRSPGGLLVGKQSNLVAGSRRDTAEHALRRTARYSDPCSRHPRTRSDGEANVRRPLFF